MTIDSATGRYFWDDGTRAERADDRMSARAVGTSAALRRTLNEGALGRRSAATTSSCGPDPRAGRGRSALGGCETMPKARNQRIERTGPHTLRGSDGADLALRPGRSDGHQVRASAVLKAAAQQAVGLQGHRRRRPGPGRLGRRRGGQPTWSFPSSRGRGGHRTPWLRRWAPGRTQFNITAVGEAGAITSEWQRSQPLAPPRGHRRAPGARPDPGGAAPSRDAKGGADPSKGPARVCIIEKRGAETADRHGRRSQVGGGVAASANLETHSPEMRSAPPAYFFEFFPRGGRSLCA